MSLIGYVTSDATRKLSVRDYIVENMVNNKGAIYILR